MVKVKLKEHKEKKPSFPCLMVTLDGDVIVYMQNQIDKHSMKGMVVWSEYKPTPEGYISALWSPERFKPYNGTIELSNGEGE